MSKKVISQLKRKCKRLGITQDMIAAAVEPRPVTRSMVSNVFGFRATSGRVVGAAQRLVAEKETAPV